MSKPYKRYVPKNISELDDLLGSMMLQSPTFLDKSGYFSKQNIENTFDAFNEGLESVRREIGEDMYLKFREMSDRMRAHFKADPENKTGDASKGCAIIREMEELLLPHLRRLYSPRRSL